MVVEKLVEYLKYFVAELNMLFGVAIRADVSRRLARCLHQSNTSNTNT
jgi:hypothetical protein